MKELKAVEILKKIKAKAKVYFPPAVMMEANPLFAELQELTQEKSCEGCKYEQLMYYIYDDVEICDSCKRGLIPDRYTPKG